MFFSPSSHKSGANGFFFDDDKKRPNDAFLVQDSDVHTALNLPEGATFDFSAPSRGSKYGALSTTPAPAPTEADKLAEAQAVKNGELSLAYGAAISADIQFKSADGTTQTYQADKGSRDDLHDMLAGFAATATAPSGFYWVASDNTHVPFTYADMQGLAQAMATRGAADFAKLQTLKDQVRAVTQMPWAAGTVTAGDEVTDGAGNVWSCTTAGKTATSEPTWPSSPATGDTVTDGAVTWTFAETLIARVQKVAW